MLTNRSNSEFSLLIVGDYLFEPRLGLLSGPSGAHHLCSRMSGLLSCLVERSERCVERDHLTDELWQDDPHASNSLNQCIARLRHYFGDTARTAQYIETVPHRGYRLVAPVYGSVKKPATVRVSRSAPQTRPAGSSLACLIQDLRQRKVCRSMLIYTIVIWLMFQVSEIVVPALNMPLWVNSLVVVLGILGFPVAAALSWIFDLTPGGLVREPANAAPSRPAPSRSRSDLVIDTVLLVAALAISGTLVASGLSYGSASLVQTGRADVVNSTFKPDKHTIAIRSFSIDGTDQLVSDVSMDVTAEILSTLVHRTEFDVLAGGALDGIDNSQISQSRGVDSVLEGSVKSDGENIQINVYLLDAHTKKYIWSQVMAQPLALRTTLAKAVSGAVLKALTVLEHDRNKGYAQAQLPTNTAPSS